MRSDGCETVTSTHTSTVFLQCRKSGFRSSHNRNSEQRSYTSKAKKSDSLGKSVNLVRWARRAEGAERFICDN